MADVYTRTEVGTVPVNCVDFKTHIKLPQVVVADDGLITSMLSAATNWGEKYTRREFRDNTYELRFDRFPSRSICLRRDPVETITSIKYLVGGVETTVDSSIYYLLKDVQVSWIVLNDEEEWPTDGDEETIGLMGRVFVEFTTQAYSCEDGKLTEAILRHASALYSERGDCTIEQAATKSGATEFYNQFRIVRI